MTQTRNASASRQRRDSSSGRVLGTILGVLIVLVVGFVIAQREIPAVNEAIESVLHPERHRALVLCREAALSASRSPDFAVIVRPGEAQEAAGGFVVRNLVIGEMAPEGGEDFIAHTCHVDAAGNVIQIHREPRGLR